MPVYVYRCTYKHIYVSTYACIRRCPWLSSQDMDTVIRVQFLDKTDCISHSTNTLGKGMNLIILPPAMDK